MDVWVERPADCHLLPPEFTIGTNQGLPYQTLALPRGLQRDLSEISRDQYNAKKDEHICMIIIKEYFASRHFLGRLKRRDLREMGK